MPTYQFSCSCGAAFEDVAPIGVDATLCSCGKQARRLFTPTLNWHWDRASNPEFDEIRANQQAWVDSPETQARIKSGELIPYDGPKD